MAHPQARLQTRAIVSLVIMSVLFVLIYLSMGYRLLEEIVVDAHFDQYHREYCQEFPESPSCP